MSSALPGAGRQNVGGHGYYVNLIDAREYAGSGFGGETAHCVRLTFSFGAGASTAGDGSTAGGSSTGGGATTMSFSSDRAYRMRPRRWMRALRVTNANDESAPARPASGDFIDQPSSVSTSAGSPPGTGGTSSGNTAGSTSGGTTGGDTSHYYFAVEGAYGSALSRNGGGSGGRTWTRTSDGTTVTGYEMQSASDTFEYRLPPGAASRKVYVVVQWISGQQSMTSFYPATLALSRRDTPAVSVDSRRVYSQPDLDGEIPADPNADPRNANFKDWVYKGGLFVGNAPASTRDQSGTARVQAYLPPGSYTYPLLTSFTLLSLGHPSSPAFANSAPYVAFTPSPSDPNLGTSTQTATWGNKWNLAASTPLAADEAQGSLPPGEYARFILPKDATAVGLALQNEDATVGNGTACWQYFANAGYSPIADPAPRAWTVDRTSVDVGWTWAGAGWGTTGP